MSTGTAIRLAMTAAGLVIAGSVSAQLSVNALATPRVQSAGCGEILWQRELLTYDPRVRDACQELNLYVPESRDVVASERSVRPEAMALAVGKVRTVDEAPPVELARASPQAALVPAARLPRTTSSWPLVALAGALALAGGLGLTLQSDDELNVSRERI